MHWILISPPSPLFNHPELAVNFIIILLVVTIDW